MQCTTAYNLIRIKLKRNDELITLLDIENKMSKLEMLVVYRRLKHNTAYIDLLNKINDIERQQLYTYDLERESEIKTITDTINNMDPNIIELRSDIMSLKPQFMEAIKNIHNLNESIPNEVYVYNIQQPPMQEHQKRCG